MLKVLSIGGKDIPMDMHTQSLVKCLNHDDKESTCAIPSSYRNFQSCPNAECRL